MAKVTWPAGRRTPRGRQNRSVGAFRDGGPPGQQRGGARGWPAAVHLVVACDSEQAFSVTAGPREFSVFAPAAARVDDDTCDERREPAEKSKPVSSAAPPPRCRPYRRLWSAFGPPFTRSSCRSTSSRRRSCSRACVDRTFQSTLPSRAFLKKAVSSPVCTVSSRLTCAGTVCPLACCTAVRGPRRDHTE